MVPLALAVLGAYRDHGPRASRRAARLRDLLRDWSMERFRAEVVGRAGFAVPRAGRPLTVREGGDHVGVTRRAGGNVVGCLVPVGRVNGDQLIEFGRLAAEYGAGELRLTVQQNVLIPRVPDDRLAGLLAEPLLRTFSPAPSPWMRSVVTCTGKDYCHFSLIDTKGEALRLARALEERYEIDEPVRLRLSGCPHACGQHRLGEVGLLGARVRRGDAVADAADVFAGGDPGEAARLGERVERGVPVERLPEAVAAALRGLRGDGAVRERAGVGRGARS